MVILSSGGRLGELLFADDFVGVSECKDQLQRLIDVVYAYCLMANVSNSAVMVFARESVDGAWKWGEHFLPRVSKYTYLGVDFTSTGAWIRKVLDNGRKKVNRFIVLSVTGILI